MNFIAVDKNHFLEKKNKRSKTFQQLEKRINRDYITSGERIYN